MRSLAQVGFQEQANLSVAVFQAERRISLVQADGWCREGSGRTSSTYIGLKQFSNTSSAGARYDRCGTGSKYLFDSVWENDGLDRTRRETFFFSLLGQAAILGLLVYFTSCVIQSTPDIARRLPKFTELPLVFSGRNGGGGGNHDALSASHGNLPRASLGPQLAPPTVILPKEPPKLAVDQSVMVAPDVPLQGGQIGDPLSQFSRVLSNGPGGSGGTGSGCCNGIGPSSGPGAGAGPPGIFPAGKLGVIVPQVIFNPEPSFSDEARKAKAQGIVMLLLVVGKDGYPYDVRVGQSLGIGLDEKAIEAVNRWRFRPATLNGQPVATRIVVQVDFHLY